MLSQDRKTLLSGFTIRMPVGCTHSLARAILSTTNKDTRRLKRTTADREPHHAAPPSNVRAHGERLMLSTGPLEPAIDRRREVRPPPELVGTLLAHAEDLCDLNDSKELPPSHSPIPPIAAASLWRSPRACRF